MASDLWKPGALISLRPGTVAYGTPVVLVDYWNEIRAQHAVDPRRIPPVRLPEPDLPCWVGAHATRCRLVVLLVGPLSRSAGSSTAARTDSVSARGTSSVTTVPRGSLSAKESRPPACLTIQLTSQARGHSRQLRDLPVALERFSLLAWYAGTVVCDRHRHDLVVRSIPERYVDRRSRPIAVLDGVFQDLEDGRLEVFVGPSKRSVQQRAVDINLVGALEAVRLLVRRPRRSIVRPGSPSRSSTARRRESSARPVSSLARFRMVSTYCGPRRRCCR